MPELSAVENFYFQAFVFLSPMRDAGMGIGCIPIVYYRDYYDIFGSPHNLPVFTRIMREIDGQYVNLKHKEQQDKK